MPVIKTKFTSPLVIRPKAKQIGYCTVIGILLAVLQVYRIVTAAVAAQWLLLVSSLLLLAACVYHITVVIKDIRADVTAMIPPIVLLSGVELLRNLLFFLDRGEIGLVPIFMLLLEIAFWCAFVPCTVRAVCGKYKLLVPLVFLFFAFFYVFMKFELRDFADIATQIGLLLILWFPIDAIAFTSLYPSSNTF